MPPASARQRHIIAGLLALLALATRWPLRSGVLDEFDSANYALAIRRFSLEEGRPHPPGYIYFVWAARPAAHLTGDPIAGLTAVAAVSGAAGMALLFELLAPALGAFVAAVAVLACTFSTQVWLQHVRPMQDSFAFACMLAAALALGWAHRRATLGAWLAACAVLGASAGAKQILPLLLCGLVAWTGRGAWARFGARGLLAGFAAATLGSLTWALPLVASAGSPSAYARLVAVQVAWQKEHESAVFRPGADLLREQAHVTFVTAFGSRRAALPVLVFAMAGSMSLWARRRPRWLLSLVLPMLAVRFFALGPWPRFSVYYVPVVLGLAVHGVMATTSLLLRPPWPQALTAAACVAWTAGQVRYILPTLMALHRGQGPVDRAVAAAAAFPGDDMVVVAPKGLVGRFVLYHAEQRGVRHAIEPDAPERARHVVGIANSRAPILSSWASGAELLGRWHLDVPRVDDLTLYRDVWQITAYELQGAQVVMRRWRTDDAGRTFATPLSRLVVFRPPGRFVLRLHGRARGPVRFLIAGGRTQAWDGRGDTHDVFIREGEGSGDRIGIDVVPGCDIPDECYELRRVEVIATPIGEPPNPGRDD